MGRGGTVDGELVLGGRRVSVRRPRARRVGGGEVRLPTYEALRRDDPLVERAVEQMLVGVSTRKYARSLETLPAAAPVRGTSRSAVSRRFVARTRAELEAWARLPLGIDASGKKHALAIREGSTENASLCRSMLADLVTRGVPADRAILVVIDGGTGLRSAVRQGFGEYGVVQRCQVHKKRNVLDHLPDHAKPHVRAAIDQAYGLDDFDKAKTLLDTLSVLKLGIGRTLRKSLSTTNPIESTFSTVRRVSRRVTRWPTGTMALRWALAGTVEAEKTWRRCLYSGAPLAQAASTSGPAHLGRKAQERRPEAQWAGGWPAARSASAARSAASVTRDAARRPSRSAEPARVAGRGRDRPAAACTLDGSGDLLA